MRGFYNYYAPTVIPCECGSKEPYWHGPEDGDRHYCCDPCWAVSSHNPEAVQHPSKAPTKGGC